MKLEKSLIYPFWLALLLLVLPSISSGQVQRFSAGLLGGVNCSQIDGDMLAGFDKIGLTGGIKTTMEFKSPWRVNFEFLYSERGSKPDVFNPEYDPDINIILKYIEIPAYVSIGDWWQEEGKYYKASAHLGLSYARLLDAQTFDHYHTAEESYDKLVPYFAENDLSWILGVSLRFSPHWGCTARYTKGIIPLLDAEKHNLATENMVSYFLTFRFEYYFK